MTPNRTNIWLLAAAGIVTAVAFVDALIGRHPDLAITTGASFALLVILMARLRWRRPAVPLRADLVEWLRDRAAVRGETVEEVLDRAVAIHRAELTSEQSSP